MSCNARSKVNHKLLRVSFRRISSRRSRKRLTCCVVAPAHYQIVTNARRHDDKGAAIPVSVALYINNAECQPRAAERKHTSTAISPSNQQTQSESPHDTAMSTRAVYRPRTAKQKYILRCWHINRCVNRDQQSESISGADIHQQQPEVRTLSGIAAAANVCSGANQAVYQQ